MLASASSEQLSRVDEILQQLDASQPPDPEQNRRRAPRVNIRVTMTALILSQTGDATLSIFTRNVSTAGIGFVCHRLCKTGERLALSFDLPDRPHKLVLAQVTFCRYVRSGVYEIGAEFKDCVSGDSGEYVPAHWIPGVQLRPASSGVPRVPARRKH